MRRLTFLILVSVLLLGALRCGAGASGADASDVTANDARDSGETASPDAAPADAADVADAADAADALAADVATPEWEKGMASTDELGSRRQYQMARAIIHLHNIFSHDACDGKPRLEDGSPNEVCHQQYRDALCANQVDFAFMTDHYGFVAETDTFADLFMPHAGDAWEDEGGLHSANILHCPDGHELRVLVGLEGEASPLGLMRHVVEGDTAARTAAYGDVSAEGVQRLRDAGAIPVAIHIEDRSDEWLDTTDLDLLEICNLHILLDPKIRVLVGLDAASAAKALAMWVFKPADYPTASDLVFLEFHQRVPYYMDQWDRELGLRMIGGFAGNDAHQNVLQALMADGERGDGYRRMTTWYVNHLLVTERTGMAARDALHVGRLYQVFEVLGTPANFDFTATRGDTVFEMGDRIPAGAPVTLNAPVPTALGYAAGADTVRMVLRKITPTEATTVYDGPGPLAYANAMPGRYRLEVFLTPNHLAPYLGDHADRLVKELPWIYSNPIEIQ